MTDKSAYQDILKSTLLFSIVKVISIAVRVVINKVVAVLLGTQGMGMIGLFYSSTDILRVVCGLGISQSAVRDVSAAYAEKNMYKSSQVIIITKRIIIITGLLGAFVTILLSPLLSKWSFGSYNYTIAFIFLGIFTFASIVNEGQTAIIRGVRNLKALAKATVFGAIIGLILGVPLYYLLGGNGIIPSMIVVSLSSMTFSWWMVSKIEYEKFRISLKETLKGAKEMIKLGIALTFVSFLGLLSDYLIRTFIAAHGSLEQVGIFQAGVVMIASYFGIVLTALDTDYYPRMFAVAQDNIELTKRMTMQVNVAFLMLTPILFIFIIFMPLIIKILYNSKFLEVIKYLQFAIFGILINVYADSLGVVLIAKQESKLLTLIVTIYRLISIPLLIIGYSLYNFLGLGIATVLNSFIHLVMTNFIVYNKHRITHSQKTNKNVLFLIFLLICALLTTHVNRRSIMFLINIPLIIVLFAYSNKQLKILMNINFISFVQKKLRKA